MSSYSGKYDLADHIFGYGGLFDKDGNPVKFGEGYGPYYSDELLDFIAFKKSTGGVLHQHKKVIVTEYNQDEVAKHCDGLRIIAKEERIADKRCAGGERIETKYSYEYYGKEYTLKELNKHGVWVTIDIHFDTLLDLVPYYPYIVSLSSHSDGKAYIIVSDESFVNMERDKHIGNGYFSDYWETYAKALQDHYRDVVLRYFNPEGYEHVQRVEFGEDCLGKVDYPIDENFQPEWRWEDGKIHSHWTSPKIEDAEHGIIRISEEDRSHYIGSVAIVYYVAKREHKINLR